MDKTHENVSWSSLLGKFYIYQNKKSITRISIMTRKWSNKAFDAILVDEEEIGDNGVYNILKDETLKK